MGQSVKSRCSFYYRHGPNVRIGLKGMVSPDRGGYFRSGAKRMWVTGGATCATHRADNRALPGEGLRHGESRADTLGGMLEDR
jgi:hypothetical protein